MKRRLLLLLVIGLIAAAILTVYALAAQSGKIVSGPFEATIHEGPNASLSLVGRLTLAVSGSGSLGGVLVTHDKLVPVTGKLANGSIKLTFHLREGRTIFGVGPAPDGLSQGVTVKGIALGPDPGDRGDWEYCIPISFQPPAVSGSSSSKEVIELPVGE